MLISLFKHYLGLYITDTALKVSQSLYCFTTSISHGVENFFPRLCGTGISDAILIISFNILKKVVAIVVSSETKCSILVLHRQHYKTSIN